MYRHFEPKSVDFGHVLSLLEFGVIPRVSTVPDRYWLSVAVANRRFLYGFNNLPSANLTATTVPPPLGGGNGCSSGQGDCHWVAVSSGQ